MSEVKRYKVLTKHPNDEFIDLQVGVKLDSRQVVRFLNESYNYIEELGKENRKLIEELDKYKATVQELQGTSSKMFDKLLENHLHKFQEDKDFDFSKTPYGRAIKRNRELKEENGELKNDMKLFVADELCEILYRFENKDIFLKDYLNKRIKDLRGTNKCE